MPTERERVRAWREGFVTAFERDRALRRKERTRGQRAVTLSLYLIDVAAEIGAFPRPRSPSAREREVAEVRRRWVRLHRRAGK